LILYGTAGIVHAILPEIEQLQFYTSTGVIKIYRELEQSKRHDSEIEKILGWPHLELVRRERKAQVCSALSIPPV
jgi:hypothetical protein